MLTCVLHPASIRVLVPGTSKVHPFFSIFHEESLIYYESLATLLQSKQVYRIIESLTTTEYEILAYVKRVKKFSHYFIVLYCLFLSLPFLATSTNYIATESVFNISNEKKCRKCYFEKGFECNRVKIYQ